MDIREQIVALHLKGLTYGQIKYATGLSRGTIGGHLSRWRIANGDTEAKLNGRLWTGSEDDDLRQMFLAGAPIPTIAKSLGRSTKAIETRIWVLRRDDKLSPRPVSETCSADKAYAVRMREADAKFVHALAAAFQRGDHLPQMAIAA